MADIKIKTQKQRTNEVKRTKSNSQYIGYVKFKNITKKTKIMG